MNEQTAKPRYDGKGDAWANSHRDGLGPTFNMSDADALVGIAGFAANTGDRLFLEYVPDNYVNRLNKIRQFATVALFDRKSSERYAFSSGNSLCIAFYLDLCRRLAQTQSVPPRFYFALGTDQPPWTMIELDINTAEELQRATIDGTNWQQVWETVGLKSIRQELRRWLDPRRP